MTTLQEDVVTLTVATTALLSAVNVKKVTLDAAVNDAQAAAALALNHANNQVSRAEAQAVISATKAGQSAASASQGAGSASQALAIYGTTNAMQAALNTAASQSQLAQTAASSASSVLQQDLSAVSAALHRSPNPVTAMFLYDTSKDSDGGAWIDRMQHTSWANEPLSGKWLGPQGSTSESDIRAAGGVGGNYHQGGDGKFYKLHAGSGSTEVFRGNTAKFPRLAMIVAEASNVTIYDLTQPGRPMWMRFVAITCGSNLILSGAITAAAGTISNISAMNGSFCVARSSDVSEVYGLNKIDFLRDSSRYYSTANRGGSFGGCDIAGVISQRNINTVTMPRPDFGIVNGAINAVAMTVLPDAPFDIATGIQIPTIAVSCSSGNTTGVSIIKHDGTVVTPPGTYVSANISFNTQGDVLIIGENSTNIRRVIAPSYMNAITYTRGPLGLGGTAYQIVNDSASKAVKNIMALSARSGGMYLLRDNPSSTDRSIASKIAENFNTGYMPGDIRRAYLCNTEVESVTGTELVTNGTFDTNIVGWTTQNAAISFDYGKLRVTGGQDVAVGTTIATKIGATYKLTFDVIGLNLTSAGLQVIGGVQNHINSWSIGGITVAGKYTYTFIATDTTTSIIFGNYGASSSSSYASYDNVLCNELILDRSYKAASASIMGTLVKSLVA